MSHGLTCLCRPPLASAAGVQPFFDLSSPSGVPFPSDRFTVLDLRHNALLRPNCAVRVLDCADLDIINTLEGFTRNAAGGYTQVFTLLG